MPNAHMSARAVGVSVVTVLIPDARQEMFRGLIDYAGLFPPASRDMAGAVAGYRAARDSAVGAAPLSMSRQATPWR